MEDFVKKVLDWDVVNWSPALRSWEKKLEGRETTGHALELGGHRGGLSLWLANKGFEVVCSDLESPEKVAAPLHQAHSFSNRISYKSIDATDIPYEDHFDIVVFKSILGGVGRDDRPELQQKAIDQIYKSLKKGGVLLFAENQTGSPFHRFFRKKFVKWGNSWRYVTEKEMKGYLTDFSNYEIRTTGFTGTFGRSEAQRNMLGRSDQLLFNWMVPGSWHYICYGWAEK